MWQYYSFEGRIFDIQAAGILPSVGLTSVKMSNWSSPLNIERELEIHKLIVQSGLPNLRGCRISVQSGLNITKWRTQFEGYHDSELVDFLEFGWLVWYVGSKWSASALVNHKGATDYPTEIDEYLVKEIQLGVILGPFDENPLCVPLCVFPLHTVPKDKTGRRVISDLSFPERCSVNSCIPKDSYLSTVVNLSYPSVDKFSEIVRKNVRGALMYKRDLSWTYRQLPLDPGDIYFMRSAWGGRLFIYRVKTCKPNPELLEVAVFLQHLIDFL